MRTADVDRPDAAPARTARGAAPANERQMRLALMQTALGYWRSQILFTAFQFGVFDALAGSPMGAESLARRSGTSLGLTTSLLDGCVALGLLKKADGRYENSATARAFLVEGTPQYMGDWVRFMAHCYEPWSHLAETVRTGKPTTVMRPDAPGAEVTTRALILGMHDYANGPGSEMVRHLDLTGRRRLLDVGGGPGTYSMMLVRKHPGLSAVVVDLPSVVKIAAELIAKWDLEGRVSTRAGSYLTDDLGTGFDVVLLSNMLHQEDPEAVKLILRKAHGALVPGGLLVIQAAFLDANKAGQTWAVLMSLQLSLFYDGGRNYSIDETLAMVRAIGFANPEVKRMSLVNSDSLILATKPAP